MLYETGYSESVVLFEFMNQSFLLAKLPTGEIALICPNQVVFLVRAVHDLSYRVVCFTYASMEKHRCLMQLQIVEIDFLSSKDREHLNLRVNMNSHDCLQFFGVDRCDFQDRNRDCVAHRI